MASGGLIQVETITFAEIAAMADFAETGFDYVSLDTEGSELDILRSIDLARHRIALFTVEHNFVEPRREQMRVLLNERGYLRVNIGFDDWYWHPEIPVERNHGTCVDHDAINRHFKRIFKDKEAPKGQAPFAGTTTQHPIAPEWLTDFRKSGRSTATKRLDASLAAIPGVQCDFANCAAIYRARQRSLDRHRHCRPGLCRHSARPRGAAPGHQGHRLRHRPEARR
nr:FkbM family methyltransferase [Bosea sp. (in: a-proteobacteria)]